jgi:hypothetical protein
MAHGEALRIRVIKAAVEGGAHFPGRDRARDPLSGGVRGDAPRGGFAHRRGPTFRAEAAPGLAPGTAA